MPSRAAGRRRAAAATALLLLHGNTTTKSVSREIERRAGTKKCRFLGPQPGHGHMHLKPEPSKLTREHYTCMYGMCV